MPLEGWTIIVTNQRRLVWMEGGEGEYIKFLHHDRNSS